MEYFLEHHDAMYDCFIALVDRSSDETYKIIKKHPKCACVIEKIYDSGYSHHKDHAVLETVCNYYPHQWYWRLDVDERVSHHFLQEMKDLPDGITNIAMRFLNLFPDHEHFISGGHTYANITAITRLSRRIERNGIPVRNDAPVYIADSLIYHLNMLYQTDRQRRYATYIHYNPEGFPSDKIQEGYAHILDVDSIRYLPTGDCKSMSELYTYLQHIRNDQSLQVKKDIDKLTEIMISRKWMHN